MSELQFKRAVRPMGMSVRWEEEGDDSKSVYLGDTVQGEYVEAKGNVGPNDSTLYTIKLEDGRLVNVWGNIVLEDQFSKGNDGDEVPVGAIVRITYLGRTQGKTGPSKQEGKGYHNFSLEFAIPSPAFKASQKKAVGATAPVAPKAAAKLAEAKAEAEAEASADEEDDY